MSPEDDNDIEENARKKLKTEQTEDESEEVTIDVPKDKPVRCHICGQYSNEIKAYGGHPNEAKEEDVALVDEKLMLFTGKETTLQQEDLRPTHKLTQFSIYDQNGHLCPFDTGIIENDKKLYFSGFIKPVYDEDSSPHNGVPAKEMGPLIEWSISGFDGGQKALLIFSTECADYYILEPTEEYRPFMTVVNKKIALTKLVIDFLLDETWENPTYEDLLQRIENHGDPDINEELLLRHAQFICDQVLSSASEEDDKPLITISCMRTLVKLAGVNFNKRKKVRSVDNKCLKKRTNKWSKATTTHLVREVFETFFTDQLDTNDKAKGPRKKRCGVCEACQQPDCGKCSHCRDKLKFGGLGIRKQACQLRRCPNMDIEEADLSENEDENVENGSKIVSTYGCSKQILHEAKWIGEKIVKYNSRTYYDSAQVGNVMIQEGDYVLLSANKPNHPLHIAKVCYMWEDDEKEKQFHAHLFCRGTDTILGETADPRELFIVDNCDNCPLGSILRTAKVERRFVSKDWALNGNVDRLPTQLEDNAENFFYCKRYISETCRFEDLQDVKIPENFSSCPSCYRKYLCKKEKQATFENDCIVLRGETYRVGNGVFLDPDAFSVHVKNADEIKVEGSKVNEALRPEYYRKNSENIKGSNVETPNPFCIGLIQDIIEVANNKAHKIKVRKFYRPENTNRSFVLLSPENINFIYWSNEEVTVSCEKIRGKCYISNEINLDQSVDDWFEAGPYRFYFNKSYDPVKKTFFDLPPEAYKVGLLGKTKGKSKLKVQDKSQQEKLPAWEIIDRPLRTLDVFSGCGGLSEGLHQAGISETKWAIEKEPSAAQAFQINNPNCAVFTDDCNEILKAVMLNEKRSQLLPKKGEVEMLVGGPPCQGFSGMNRFNAGQYSLFKNSLIVSCLSYCDYYRPHYFILENVRNFVSFKRSMILKLTLRCLLAIGYQVTFGILQAGHYGVPQTRRRLIIFAAAPGYVLPNFPEPQHVFNKRGCQLSVVVNNLKYNTGIKWVDSAPYRTITVKDAMNDLPEIKNGCSKKEMPYGCDPQSHFQRKMRGKAESEIVQDHICKEMAPIVEARMRHIPLYPGSDWRDLPNIMTRLSDGTSTNMLQYPYRTKKQKGIEPNRGVCRCATGKSCDPTDRQMNTLIPWCLPHTADRHNHWSGLYGRLEWFGFFSTTVTNPEPMGKQGRVLHPEQHRVVSVRECARSQGFPDRYQFHGSILDKHRQIGNAVPPPLSLALGREVKKAYALSQKSQ